jgi:cytoskeletal protein CcmA (bactofilin family)
MKSMWLARLLSSVFILLFMLGVFAGPAHAQSLITGNSVPSGQVINDDVILFGDSVTIDGDVNGNVIAIGNTVTLNGTVDGSLVALAQDVRLNGEVTDSAYAASLTLDLGKASKVARNLTYVGASAQIPPGATIGRDLKGIFMGAVLGGNLGGNIRAIVGPVEVVRFILDALNVQIKLPNLRPIVPQGTPAAPTTTPPPATPSSYLPLKVLAAYRPLSTDRAPSEQATKTNPVLNFLYSAWLSRQVKQFATLFILGLLLVLLFPAFLTPWATRARQALPLSAGYGLLLIILGNIAAVILLLVVLAIGAGIYALKLDSLAFLTLGMGVSAVGVAYAVFILFTTYLSKIVVAYLVGWLLLRRWERPSRWWMLLPFLLGLLIYTLVVAIPFLGWAISIIVAAVGSGAIYLSIFARRGQLLVPPAEPAA